MPCLLSRPPQKWLPLPPTPTRLPSLERMRKLIGPKRQHARQEPHGIILKGQNPRRRHQHDGPPLRPLLVRDVAMPLGRRHHASTTLLPCMPSRGGGRGGGGRGGGGDTILPEIRRAIVETLAHLGEFQPRGNDHDAQERPRERAQQVEQRRPQEQAQQELERAQHDDARPAARAKAVLRRQAARAVAHGHGAEPAPHEIHCRNGETQLGNGGRTAPTAAAAVITTREVGHLAHEFGGERSGGDDRVECGQGQLGDGHGPGAGRAKVWDHGEGMPDLKGGEAVGRIVVVDDGHSDDGQDETSHKDDQGVGKVPGGARGQDEEQEGGQGPEAVVQGGIDPAQLQQHGAAARENQLQPRPKLDPLDHGDGNMRRQPAQQAGDAQEADGGADEGAGGEGLALGGVGGEGGGGDGLHGLDGQRDAKDDAGEDVEEAREDQGAGQGDGALQGEGDHERQEGAQVAERARHLGHGLPAEGADVVPVQAGHVLEGHGGRTAVRFWLENEIGYNM